MSKKSSTTTNQTSSGTTSQNGTMSQSLTPTNPAWVNSGLEGLGGQISNLSNLDPYSLVAGPNALQTTAATGAGQITNSPWAYDGAQDITRGIAQANSPQTQYVDSSKLIGKFMSPYISNVVNSSLADYDYGAGQTRAQDALAKAGDTTFGGSGGAIQTALSNDAINRGRAALSSGLYNQGFNTALSAAQSEAARKQAANDTNAQLMGQQSDRALTAAGQMAGIAGQFGDQQRATAATQAGIGSILQQLEQARAQAPLSLLGTQAGLFSGLPLGLEHGQNVNGTSTMNGTYNDITNGTSTTKTMDPFGAAGGLLSGLGSLGMGLGALGFAPFGAAAGLGGSAASGTLGAFVSDRRMKRDVQKIGTRADGLGVYAFRYLWDRALQIGVMAQEVLGVKPEAVVTLPGGVLAVNYGAL